MKLVVDTHTHTISSGHAYSTLQENAKEASQKGLEMIAMTDHGPSITGAPELIHFSNLRILPDQIYNVRILKGVEANIIDYQGSLDVPDRILSKLDFVLASFHDICIRPGTVEDHTNAMVAVLKNPLVDAVAHPGNPMFQVDIERVVETALEYNKFIEINNHTFNALTRKGSEENCRNFIRECRKKQVKIVCGSDAHVSFDVGNFNHVKRLLLEEEMPEELIMNTSAQKFEEYLSRKKDMK